MEIIAFILALIAIVLFLVEYTRTRSWYALGWACLVVAWIVQLVVVTGSHVSIH